MNHSDLENRLPMSCVSKSAEGGNDSHATILSCKITVPYRLADRIPGSGPSSEELARNRLLIDIDILVEIPRYNAKRISRGRK